MQLAPEINIGSHASGEMFTSDVLNICAKLLNLKPNGFVFT